MILADYQLEGDKCKVTAVANLGNADILPSISPSLEQNQLIESYYENHSESQISNKDKECLLTKIKI